MKKEFFKKIIDPINQGDIVRAVNDIYNIISRDVIDYDLEKITMRFDFGVTTAVLNVDIGEMVREGEIEADIETETKINEDLIDSIKMFQKSIKDNEKKTVQRLINKGLEEIKNLGGDVEDFKAKNAHLKGKELFLEIERELDGLRIDYGLASDEFELYSLIGRRGKEWIENELTKLSK